MNRHGGSRRRVGRVVGGRVAVGHGCALIPHSRSSRIQDHFSTLTDPRRREGTYPLINIVTIALCAVIAGADDFVAIAAWVTQKRKWLGGFLDLSDGIPSHDRFNAILGALKPAKFERCLLSWIAALHEITTGQVVAIDGKQVCTPTGQGG